MSLIREVTKKAREVTDTLKVAHLSAAEQSPNRVLLFHNACFHLLSTYYVLGSGESRMNGSCPRRAHRQASHLRSHFLRLTLFLSNAGMFQTQPPSKCLHHMCLLLAHLSPFLFSLAPNTIAHPAPSHWVGDPGPTSGFTVSLGALTPQRGWRVTPRHY